jgi:Rrf2 family protein
MLRLSKLTDYAVVVLIRLADGERSLARMGAQDAVQTSPGIAAATGVPEPTVAKVLKALACANLVVSQRGARGGYRLGRPISCISVADVIAAVDGPIALTACVEGGAGGCDVHSKCAMRGR